MRVGEYLIVNVLELMCVDVYVVMHYSGHRTHSLIGNCKLTVNGKLFSANATENSNIRLSIYSFIFANDLFSRVGILPLKWLHVLEK